MTAAVAAQRLPQSLLDKAAIGLFALLAAGVLWYFVSQQQYTLRNSAAGFDGLQIWLSSEDHTAQSFAGGWPLKRESVGLLVQPVFDTQLRKERAAATTEEEVLLQPDEFDQRIWVIRAKMRAVPSLVILPKWRSGLRLTGQGHPVLRVPQSRVQDTLHEIGGTKVGKIHYAPEAFTDIAIESSEGRLTAKIYAAQLFDGTGCDPLIGQPGRMLLGLCPIPGHKKNKVYVLSDPDLLNNHGLRLGDNAKIAATLLPEFADEKRIVIDYSAKNWLTAPQRSKKRDRSWADLARLFGFPFTILWVGAGLLLALAIWRGGLRSGPVDRPDTRAGLGNRSANLVRARLMRSTDQDGALLTDYVNARMQVQAATVLGPAVAGEAAERSYLRYVHARAPALAEKLVRILERIRSLPEHLDAAEAIEHVSQFESTLEQIVHDT